jgi:hypothetical protein
MWNPASLVVVAYFYWIFIQFSIDARFKEFPHVRIFSEGYMWPFVPSKASYGMAVNVPPNMRFLFKNKTILMTNVIGAT